MPIRDWSTTPGSNNEAPPFGAPEGHAPSATNNIQRQVMADVRSAFENLPWFDFGQDPTRIDNDTFTVATDLTTTYAAGRRVKLVGATTGYATIASSSYSAPDTTVNVTMDSGNVPTSLLTVALGPDSNSTFTPRYDRTAAEIAAGVTPVDYLIPNHDKLGWVIPDRYAVNTTPGTTDMTTAISNALLVCNQLVTSYGGARLQFLDRKYKVVSTLSVIKDRIHIVGMGEYATRIMFAPTAADTLFHVIQSGTTINQGSIRNLTLFSDDSTYTKVGIDLVDISGYKIDVVIGGSVAVSGAGLWSGGSGSIGIRTNGRDFNRITATSNADKPLVIAVNPNGTPQISLDHTVIELSAIGGNYPIVTIDAGVVLTQVTLRAIQAWVHGQGGIYWVDATTPGGSNGLVIDNVRGEGSLDPTKYYVHIDVASELQMLTVNGGQMGAGRGFYLRNITRANFNGFFYSDTTREALNANSTVDEMHFTGCVWNTGSTATLTGLTIYSKSPTNLSQPLPSNGLIIPSPTGSLNEINEATLAGVGNVIANNGTITLGGTNHCGMTAIATSDGANAIYSLNGTNHTTIEVSDPAGIFSATQGTATSYNIYWDAGSSTYKLENTRGGSRTVYVTRFGTGQ